MSTEKTIKIQKNKVLTYSINKTGFKTVYGSVLVNENQNINVEMINLNSETSQFQLGDRLFGISSFVDYFTPSGIYDVDSLKYISATQTTGSDLTNIAVIKNTWLSKVETELGIETPKGTSNNFIFTYNGSTWDITGALTLAGQSLENFGISFDGTPAENDVITVTETQYNKFAFFVLDSNYRLTQIAWVGQMQNYSHIDMPVQYTYGSTQPNVKESATFSNNYIWDNYSVSTFSGGFKTCKDFGNFILPNGIKINALVPNWNEGFAIYNSRIELDDADPTIIESGQTKSLTLWKWPTRDYNDRIITCTEYNNTQGLAVCSNSSFGYANTFYKHLYNYNGMIGGGGFVPIFEVPVM